MPHIHTGPNQIDFIAEVFVVYKDKVLLRLHEKYQKWIAPGGHIEIDETPEEAAVREIREEVGLDIVLWRGNAFPEAPGSFGFEGFKDLVLPSFANIHKVNSDHRHLVFVYFGTSETDKIIQPGNHEKAECRWLTKEDIESADYIDSTIKTYALTALEILANSKSRM